MIKRRYTVIEANDIRTSVKMLKKYTLLKITLKGYQFYVRIYNSFEELDAFISSYEGTKVKGCCGSFMRNVSALIRKKGQVNKTIGTIALTYQALTRPIVIHECTHAALAYHALVFNECKGYMNTTTTIGIDKEEEFFCTLISCLSNEILNFSEGSYRVLMHTGNKNKIY